MPHTKRTRSQAARNAGKRALAGAALSVSLIFPPSVFALDIVLDFLFDTSSNPGAAAAFSAAESFWEGQLTDNVTVTIEADFKPIVIEIPGFGTFPSNSLAETSPTAFTTAPEDVNGPGGFDLFRNAMVADQIAHKGPGDITDDLPTATGPTQAAFSLPALTFNAPLALEIDGMSITLANAKAMQAHLDPMFPLPPSLLALRDGLVTLNSDFILDFDPSDGVMPAAFDAEAALIHEFGHVLGFISEHDRIDTLMTADALGLPLQPSDVLVYPTPLDLFRLSPGAGAADFTGATRDLLPGAVPMDVSFLGPGFGDVPMEPGTLAGLVGAGHFLEGEGGLMDSGLMPGEVGMITAADLRAFDVIGWDVGAAVIPIPPAIYLFSCALIGMMGMSRRRSSS